MALEFVLSEKGKRQLLLNGFLFYANGINKVNGNTYWKCVYQDKEKKHCLARVVTSRNDEVLKEGIHNHAGQPDKIGAIQITNKMKESAVTSSDTPHVLIASASADIHDSVAAHLPSTSSIKRTIRNIRNVAQEDLAHPLTRKEIQLPPQYSVTE